MHQREHAMGHDMGRCIQECMSCHAICTSTGNHCLNMSGEHASAQHITTLLDCAEACRRCAESCRRMAAMA